MKYSNFDRRASATASFIVHFEDVNGYPPSGEDIATGLEITRSYAYDLLRKMEEEGLIERGRRDGRPVGRNIRLTKAAMKLVKETMK